MMKRIVVCGFMGACPISGVVWQHIHYILGLKKLGIEVIYIEDSAKHPYDPVSYAVGEAAVPLVAKILERLAKRFDFQWVYRARFTDPMQIYGNLNAQQIRDAFASADATFNLCGAQELNPEVLLSPCLVYVESDPGVEQIKLDQGNASTRDYLGHHHVHFTFGEKLGKPDCPLPQGGIQWHPTRQPVAMELWKGEPLTSKKAAIRATTIANWETKGKDIVWKNSIYYWSKVFEFLKFSDLPGVVSRPGISWEIATDMNRDPASKELYQRQGWNLVPPNELSADYDAYIRYIQNSGVEWTVAKDQYVRLKTGWFSDRSACYLAAGRPVITQDTGFGDVLPVGEGLYSFKNIAEIEVAVDQILTHPEQQSQRAYEIADTYFRAEHVVGEMLSRL